MIIPNNADEIVRFFNSSEDNFLSLTPEELFFGINELLFPNRTMPWPLVWAYIAVAACEGWLRNESLHYGQPGQLMPMNRLYTFDNLSCELRRFKMGRATHKAVGQIYHHRYGIFNKDTLKGKFEALLTDLTFNTDHALGLIGRYLIVKKLLENALLGGKISTVASLACGAGEAVVNAVAAAQKKGLKVKTAFQDINDKALEMVEKQLVGLPPGDNAFYLVNVIKNQRWFSALPVDALELVGLIDYISDKHLIKFLRSLKNPRLKLLISCNILRKPGLTGELERFFLRHALQWPLYYRTEDQLRAIFQSAGYEKVRLISEPYSLFSVVVWFKQ